ncbi:unnamed protein product [Absidia cylindrospora]
MNATYGSSVSISTRKNTHTVRQQDNGDELQYLENELGKMDGLSSKLTGILDSFDGRLLKLEASIYQSTSQRKILQDSSIISTRRYLPLITFNGSPEGCGGYDEKSQLKSCEKATFQTKQLLKAGMLHLETLFRKWLTTVCHPVDVHTILESDEIMPSSTAMKQLSQLATYIATSVTEIGYAVDFTKPYADIRSVYMQNHSHHFLNMSNFGKT